MRAVLDHAGYLGLLTMELVTRSIPPRGLVALADLLGRLWYALDGRRRSRARESLRIASLGGLRIADREALVRQTFQALMMIPIEVLVFPRYARTTRDVLRRVTFYGDIAGFRDDVRAGRGGVAIAGHLGSWELAAWVLRFIGVPARVVVRPIENPHINRRTMEARGGGGRVIEKRGAVREVIRALRGGDWVAILTDQNAGRGGPFVPFFGTVASTYATAAVAAVRTGAPVWAAACLRRRRPPLHYEMHVRRLPPPPADLDERAAVAFTLAAFKQALEGWIRQAPEQYNWVHRRWKTRPRDEVPGTDTPRYRR